MSKIIWQQRWRQTSYYARVLHIYFSSFLLALLILFCLTGIVLNHVEWLSGTSNDGTVEIQLPEEIQKQLQTLQQGEGDPPYNEIQAWLRENYSLSWPESIDYDAEFFELVFDYQIPGGYAAAIIDGDGLASLEYRQGSWWSVMGDLHKGRHSGKAWSWVIDISAALMIVFAVTGMIILFQNRRHRRRALIVAVLGTVSPFIIYWLWVPKLLGV